MEQKQHSPNTMVANNGSQAEANQIDADQVVADLLHGPTQPSTASGAASPKLPSQQHPLDSKMAGLREMHRVLVQEKVCTSAAFLGHLEELFRGLRSCLQTQSLQQLQSEPSIQSINSSITAAAASQSNSNQVSDYVIDIVLKANQVLFEMMPDIQRSDDLEIQMAQLIPIFIENLGSPKAVVRKSTHKCIGTYVKLTRKLEFVVLHIIYTGLENPNSRTRQHSMLVIPALLSLKASIMEKECPEMKELVQAVIKRIKSDQSEIVSKTGKKLILELQKCYPVAFKNQYIDKLRSQDERLICQAVLNNDDATIKQIVAGTYRDQNSVVSAASGSGAAANAASQLILQSQQSQTKLKVQQNHNELSVAGREIIQSSNHGSEKSDLDSISQEAKHESRYPRAQNGLLFAFLRDELVEALDEKNQWKKRTTAIETIESELNQIIQSNGDRKMNFMPYATPFLGFIMQFIKDINFKICLTAIQITNKLLVLNLVNLKKYYTQLVIYLIEKLSDSKVVIRQAVLKCCGQIIKSHKPNIFAHQAIKYLQHTNWHVREGILHLIANCLIAQSHLDELNGAAGENRGEIAGSSQNSNNANQMIDVGNGNLATSPSLISELCQAQKIEAKSKIQQMTIDCLALTLDISPNKPRTEQIIVRELGVGPTSSSQDLSGGNSRDNQMLKDIKERQNPDCLPAMQIDGSIEFKPAGMTALGALPQQENQSMGQTTSSAIASQPTNYQQTENKTSLMQVRQSQEASAQSSLKQNQNEINNAQLQMRFQQDRIQGSRIGSSQQSTGGVPAQQQKELNIQNDQASESTTNQQNIQKIEQNRQQYSLSTINNTTSTPLSVQGSGAAPGFPEQRTPNTKNHRAESTQQDKGRENNMVKLNTAGANILSNNRRSDTIGSGIIYQDSSINNKTEPTNERRHVIDVKDFKDNANGEPSSAQLRDGNKISMWLPSFQEQQANKESTQQQLAMAEKRVLQSPSRINTMNSQNQQIIEPMMFRGQPSQQPGGQLVGKVDRLSATASSSATFVDDGRSIGMSVSNVYSNNNTKYSTSGINGLQSFQNRNQPLGNGNDQMISQSPILSENQTAHHYMAQKTNAQFRSMPQNQGQTPDSSNPQSRQISSYDMRQRTLDEVSLSQASPSPKNSRIRMGQKNPEFISIQQSPLINDSKSSKAGQTGGIINPQMISQSDIKIHQQRNMSQSSGAPGGFGVQKAAINERLQLLKSTFKYKNQSEINDGNDDQTQLDPHFRNPSTKANSEYNARGLGGSKNAEHIQERPLNNNNYMMSTGGVGVEGGAGASVPYGKDYSIPQQTHNSFGFSNVSTNINNTNSNLNSKSFSANKQLQSTNTTGYNFSGNGNRKIDYNQYPANTSNNFVVAGNNRTALKGDNSQHVGSSGGPVKATLFPKNDYMQTIQVEDGNSKNQSNDNSRSQSQYPNTNESGFKQNQPRTRKPPTGNMNVSKAQAPQASDVVSPSLAMTRANSVNAPTSKGKIGNTPEALRLTAQPNSGAGSADINTPLPVSSIAASTSTTYYTTPEEPLHNPENQYKQAQVNLKSDDWQKVFDSLNVVKRVAMFHKNLLSIQSGTSQKECIKNVVKQTDNLRSQVAKNACMTVQVIFSELPTRDLDPNIDSVLQPLIKKATDTNHFVSEQAEKALVMVCHAGTESKVFNSLQNMNGRSNPIKQKICMSYGCLIDKLGPKIKTFKDSDRLIKTIVSSLSEGAIEVRNQAKLNVLSLKNNLPNGRDFDGLLLRCNLTDKQIEQVQKVVEQENFESLSNINNTKYGGSMRGSSMDSRGGVGTGGMDAQRRTPNAIPRAYASGDGFAQGATQSDVYGATQGSGQGFGQSQQAFKKRQASVSKPVDPALMEEFKNMIQQCNTHDWSKRLQSIDTLNDWIANHSITVKQTQPAKFIQLVDINCTFLQDNNAKVQGKALSSFRDFLLNENLRQLIDQNLTMIIQALSHNLASSSPNVRTSSEQLMNLLEDTTDVPEQLIQPIVAQLNLSNTRSKPQLVYKLADLALKVKQQKANLVERYVIPLTKPNHKIQSEATINKKLQEALQHLDMILNRL